MPQTDSPINAWWSAFQAKSIDIDALFNQKTEWDLVEWMQQHLGPVHPKLMWEFGPAIHKKGHRLVITPESRRDLRPIVASLLKHAPKMDGWEFYGYRLAEDYEMTVQTVEARTGGDISRTFVHISPGDYNKIDLTFVSDGYSEDDQQAFSDVFVATETLLGEEVLDKWIGAIEVEAHSADFDAAFPIEELQARVNTMIEQTRGNLPDQPYHKFPDEHQWTLYELQAEEQEDYPEQQDMFVGRTMNAPLWLNAHSNQPFDSVRFSKQGEVFCYVKIDGTEDSEATNSLDKSEIEDALDAALKQADIGCTIGGGTGLKYSYIDLALTDMERGAAIVKGILQKAQITNRSWLQFFDADLQARWIGIWDDTPPPPLPDFE